MLYMGIKNHPEKPEMCQGLMRGLCLFLFFFFFSGILVAHYLQSITPALALGGELVYHRRPGEEGTVTSVLGRYTGESRTLTLRFVLTKAGTCVYCSSCLFHRLRDVDLVLVVSW